MLAIPKDHELVDTITRFFSDIGIAWQFGEINDESFLPGVKISKGSLIIDKAKLAYPGDLLHEAGHLAIEPPETRMKLDDNVRECGQDDAEEIAAIAWSWAALDFLELPPEVVFHEAGYHKSSESLVNCFRTGGLYGQPLLGAWGLCKIVGQPDGFPKMENWLRPSPSSIVPID